MLTLETRTKGYLGKGIALIRASERKLEKAPTLHDLRLLCRHDLSLLLGF